MHGENTQKSQCYKYLCKPWSSFKIKCFIFFSRGWADFIFVATLHLSRPDSLIYKSFLKFGLFPNTLKILRSHLFHFPSRKVWYGFPPPCLTNQQNVFLFFTFWGPCFLRVRSLVLETSQNPGDWTFKVSCPTLSAHLPATSTRLHLIFNPENYILSLSDAIRPFLVLIVKPLYVGILSFFVKLEMTTVYSRSKGQMLCEYL